MSPTICLQCGDAMERGGDCPPSLGNPNVCVLCAAGFQKIPDDGSSALRPTDGPSNLPPATAPLNDEQRDGGTATTPAGGNPFPDQYVATPQNADRYTGHTEAAASGPPAECAVDNGSAMNESSQAAAGGKSKQPIIQPPYPYGRWTERSNRE